MSQANLAVELEGIEKRYGRRWPWSRRKLVRALNGVDLSVPTGSVLGVVGLNGAGKTSLLKVVATLVEPDAGRGKVLGHGLIESGPAVRRSVGFVVADERSFYWRLSGRHNAAFFGALQGLKRPCIDEKLRQLSSELGLRADILERPVRTYSSGMRKKLALIRAMLHEPRVLLFDEATRGLDPAAARRLRRLVRDGLVARHGVSGIWATHDLSELDDICERVALIHHGEVLVQGTPAEVRFQVEAHFARFADNDEDA